LHGAEPQHPAGVDFPRPRPSTQPIRDAGGDRRQQPSRPHAASGGGRSRDAALLRRTSGRRGGTRPDPHHRRGRPEPLDRPAKTAVDRTGGAAPTARWPRPAAVWQVGPDARETAHVVRRSPVAAARARGSRVNESGTCPLSWRQLEPCERRPWFESLWRQVCMLRERYRLMVRSGWWEDEIQVEALAALADWATSEEHTSEL